MATEKSNVFGEHGEREIRRQSAVGSINLNKNLSAKVSNPLADVPYEELMHDVELFAQDKGMLDKVDLLKRGALVAQNPANFETIGILGDDEREALRFEATHKWRHPLALYFTIIMCSIGAAVQGWDQTGYVTESFTTTKSDVS